MRRSGGSAASASKDACTSRKLASEPDAVVDAATSGADSAAVFDDDAAAVDAPPPPLLPAADFDAAARRAVVEIHRVDHSAADCGVSAPVPCSAFCRRRTRRLPGLGVDAAARAAVELPRAAQAAQREARMAVLRFTAASLQSCEARRLLQRRSASRQPHAHGAPRAAPADARRRPVLERQAGRRPPRAATAGAPRRSPPTTAGVPLQGLQFLPVEPKPSRRRLLGGGGADGARVMPLLISIPWKRTRARRTPTR